MKINSAKSLAKNLYNKLINRETITYIIAGVMTTAVNFICYEGLYQIGIPNLTANAIAWVIAVIFAYIVNKLGVFLAKSNGLVEEAVKIIKFFAARLVTLGIEQAGMYFFIDKLGFHHLKVKAMLAIIVIILNYVFSKLYIFKKHTHSQMEA